MSELTNLKQSVMQQVEERGKLWLERETAKIQAQYEQDLAKLRADKQAQKEVRLKQLKDEHDQQIQQINNQKRQSSLASKQELLQALFNEAVQQMETSDIHEQIDFFNQTMQAFTQEPVQVHFGEKTGRHFNDETYNYLEGLHPQADFSRDLLAGEGGFIISSDKIDYNYLYSRMVEHVQGPLSQKLAQEIFGPRE